MTDRDRVSFGIKTTQWRVSYDDILACWRDADTVPEIEHAWLWDHLVPLRGEATGPLHEAWTLLAALAGQTERLRLGLMVSSNRTRPPAVLAKMAATTDVISHGRLVFGIGVGATRVPGENPGVREYEAYGLPLVSPREGVEALSESCTIARRLWTEGPFDFDGRHYQLKGAVCEPKPVQRPHPPVLIGGTGEKGTLRWSPSTRTSGTALARPGSASRSSAARAAFSTTTAPPSVVTRGRSRALCRSLSAARRRRPRPARWSPS
jgi:hypothetical protein